jgi:hypothetical protein
MNVGAAGAPIPKRPIGATLLALVLGWLGVAGLLNSFVWWLLPADFVKQASRQLQFMLTAVRTPMLSLIALAYGFSALATCILLWRMRPQIRVAMACWVVSAIMFAICAVALCGAPIASYCALTMRF